MQADPDRQDVKNGLSDEALHWIVRLNSGTATPQEQTEWMKWRSTSTNHENAAREAQMLWNNMSRLHVDSSTGLVKPEKQRHNYSRRDALGVMLGIGVAGTAGTLWATGSFQRFTADYRSATGNTKQIDLSDGSRVLLNARSAIDVRLDQYHRRVTLLEGQAYFEVAADMVRPFEVIVDDISIVALGTAFDVSRAMPNVQAEVAVTEHNVRITSRLRELGDFGTSVEISAGQSVIIDKAGQIGALRNQDASITTAWRNGVYIAEERALVDVVAALSAWNSGFIFFSDASLGSLKVNAVLDLRDLPSSLNVLDAGLPIRVRNISKYIAVISKA